MLLTKDRNKNETICYFSFMYFLKAYNAASFQGHTLQCHIHEIPSPVASAHEPSFKYTEKKASHESH